MAAAAAPMNQEPTQCTEFWFSNRMIVIKVEDTILQVHVDVLARHREVFRDLLALPQPADAKSIDGTPVVRIEGTSVEDMRLLLGYMYNSVEYQQALSDYLGIARLLRLSHKYLVTHLRKHLMELLAPMFPSTFEGFLIAETDAMRGSAPFDYTSTQCCAIFANTFCDVDAQLLLPITLLRLCRSSLEDIALSSLSSENTHNLLIGRSRLASIARETVFLHNFHNSDTCGACASCSQRCFSKKGAITILLGDDFWLDPLCERDVSYVIICSRCATSFRNSHSSGRKIAWERLPGFFNLPAWPQLHAAESAFNSHWYALHIVRTRSYSYWPWGRVLLDVHVRDIYIIWRKKPVRHRPLCTSHTHHRVCITSGDPTITRICSL